MNNKINSSYKVIADHLRSSAFLIADGILPSNEGRGYVLRRIMRRAMLHSHKLNEKEAFIYKLVPTLVNKMSDAFPELKEAQDLIINSLKIEEERFRKNLAKGIEVLEKESKNIKNNKFNGQTAFKLYDTYGFPLDLTQTILKERNIEVNISSFENEMQKQRDRARKNWSGSGSIADDSIYFNLKEKLGVTDTNLIYEAKDNEGVSANIIAIIKDGKEVGNIKEGDKNVEIILNQTPFYATSGGQRGDEGQIQSSSKDIIEIKETVKKAEKLFVHIVSKIQGEFKVGDEIEAQVNRRSGKKRAHSATHLLHYILRKNFGKQLTQKGSDVANNSFTFDFNHNEKILESDLERIEDEVNQLITQKTNTTVETIRLEEAKKKGAVALFGEKYGEVVRVLSMGKDKNNKYLSVEFCGGTHVENLGDIECFKIISEKSIAAGIRRITAKTSISAIKDMEDNLTKLNNKWFELRDRLIQKCQEGNISGFEIEFDPPLKTFENNDDIGKIDEFRKKIKEFDLQILNLQEKLKKVNKEIEKKKKEQLSLSTDFENEKINNINLIHHYFEDTNAKDLRDAITQIKSKKENNENTIICFFSSLEGKVAVAIAISQDLCLKFNAGKLIPVIVENIGGKGGGGKPDLAFGGGNNKDGIKNAIEVLKTQLLS